MNYNIFLLLAKIYTFLLKKKFFNFGKYSTIKPFLNSFNENQISIGNKVNIGSFCRITACTEFNGIKCKSSNPIKIKIGNNVDIGNNSFITANNKIEIGNNIIMSSYVFISDHDHGFKDITKNLHQQPLTENGYIIIKDNVFLGVKSSILKNITIGEHSVVAANSVVTKDVPAFSVVAGNPAKIIQKYDPIKKKWIKQK